MTKTASTYGTALYELAGEENCQEQILSQLQQIVALFDANPDYGRLLSTFSIAKQARCDALKEAFGGRVHPYVLNFLRILCENGQIGQLSDCLSVYRRLWQQAQDIIPVTAVTAVALSDALQQALRQKLESMLQKKVLLTCRQDPDCMGGVRLQLPDRQLDGTIRHRLDDLSRSLQKTL